MKNFDMPILVLSDPTQIIPASEFCQNISEPILVIYGKQRRLITPANSEERTRPRLPEFRDLSKEFPFEFLIACDKDDEGGEENEADPSGSN